MLLGYYLSHQNVDLEHVGIASLEIGAKGDHNDTNNLDAVKSNFFLLMTSKSKCTIEFRSSSALKHTL